MILKEKKFRPDFSKFDCKKSYRRVKKGHAKMMERTRSRTPLWKMAARRTTQKAATKVGSVRGGSQGFRRFGMGLYDEKDIAARDPDDGGYKLCDYE